MHVASAGGVWAALVSGFGGMRDHGGVLSFDPRLPEGWRELRFPLTVTGGVARVTVRRESLLVERESGGALRFLVRGEPHEVAEGATAEVRLADQGPRRAGRPSRPSVR